MSFLPIEAPPSKHKPLTEPPLATASVNTLNPHSLTTSLKFVISIPNLKSGLSEPYFSIASLNVILFIGVFTSTPKTSLNT